MADRTVTDSAGRTWTCAAAPRDTSSTEANQGQDVVLTCATPSVGEPVHITVGWQWEAMSANGLARLLTQASPALRR